MALTQKNRRFRISTPLGADALVLQNLTGEENISRLFNFEAELHSEDLTIDHEAVLGENVTVTADLVDGSQRFLNGVVSHFKMVDFSHRHVIYRATISPWLWLLTRTSDCRIFQEKSVPDIVKEVLNTHGFSDIEDRLSGSYRTWEYCVQYRETDFNFISRLLEQEGIYYYFLHDDGKHSLVLADSPSAHQPASGYDTIPFFPPDDQNRRETEHFHHWSIAKEIQPGKFATQDFDFKAPKKDLFNQSQAPGTHTAAEFPVYDYPGEFTEAGDGENYVKARMQELKAKYEIATGLGDPGGIFPGAIFSLDKHPLATQNREYLIIGAAYSFINASLESSVNIEESFSVRINAIESSHNYRAPRSSPKPMMRGVQTAIVVGPAGEEIYTDKYGRVKCQFHWDRYGTNDENSSCWMRVSHGWAGKNWGAIHTPRIGQEVIVDFIEGDPDRPIITGRVYNNDNMPPYDLPANKTQSGIKSRSSKGGDPNTFNEIRFEDKKGDEQVYVHAEKNQDNIVENDETTDVGHDRTETVGNDETITIGNDRTEKVGNNETITIGNDRTENVGNNESITIGVDRTENVGSNESITIGVDRTENVGSNETIGIGSNRTETVGSNETVSVALMRTHNVGVNDMLNVGVAQEVTVGAAQAISVGANRDINVGINQSRDTGSNLTESVGKNFSTTVGDNLTTKVGKKFMLDVGDEIVIKTGKASLTMKKDGTIVLKGKDVSVDGSGKITIKAKKNLIQKGKKILEN